MILKLSIYNAGMPYKSGNFAKYNGMRGGRIGGKKAAANMTPEQRQERAKKAIAARWAKARAAKEQIESA